MAAWNRVTGVVRIVSGLGGVTFGVCLCVLGHWWTLPVAVYGVMRTLAGAVQVVTGAGEYY